MDLVRALAAEPQTTQLNVVALVAGEFYSIYPIASGLVIPVVRQILSKPRISGISFDLRRVSTPIGTFGFELEDSVAKDMLTVAGNWLQTDCTIWIGDALNSDWAEYTKLMSGIIVDISTKTNAFVFNCKEILDLVFKDFKREAVLSSAITDVVTIIPIDNSSLFQTAGVARIDGEFIGYTGRTATELTGATRGIFGSEAKEHSELAPVYSDYHFFQVNPITIMLQLMISQNGLQANGPYDVLQLGLGIDENLIDVASFESVRDEWFSDAVFTLEIYNIGNLLTFLETEILQPLNCRLVTTNGKITLTLLDNYTADPVVPTFNEDIVVGVPSWKIESNKIINTVEVYFAYDFALGKFSAKKIYQDQNSIDLFGVKGPHKFEFKGIEDSAGGIALIDRLIEKFLLRMSKSRGSISCQTYYNAFNVHLGANVLLDHRYVPQIGFGMGISTVLENLSKSIDLGTGNVQFNLEFMSTAEFRTAVIGPSSNIISVITDTQFIVDDISLFAIGHRIELMGQDRLYLPDAYRTITGIVDNTIAIDAPFEITTITPDIFIKLARYNDATAEMKRDFGYIAGNGIADATPTMFSNSDPIGYFAAASDNKIIKNDITPTMSSNTAPAGYVASSNSDYDANYQAWRVFNKTTINSGDAWHTAAANPTGWVKLKFPSPVIVNAYRLISRTSADASTRSPKNWTIEGSQNDLTWTILDTQTDQINWTPRETREFEFSTRNNSTYLYYRINISANSGNDPNFVTFGELTFYEILKTNPIIPSLTSNTTPTGYIASTSLAHASYPAWYGFDGDDATNWSTGDYTIPHWLKIELPTAKIATSFRYWNATAAAAATNYNIEGSNDNAAWTVLRNITGTPASANLGTFSFSNTVAYKYYRLYIFQTAGAYGTGGQLQIYESASISEPFYAYDGRSLAWESNDSGKTLYDIGPTMTSNTTPAPFVASASTQYDATWQAWQVFNKVQNTMAWISLIDAIPAWLKIDLVQSYVVTKYSVTSRNEAASGPNQAPKNFTFEGSKDNLTWVILDTRTDQTAWVATGEKRDYYFFNSNAYRYYRLNMSACNLGQYLSVGEITLYGEVLNSITPKWNSLKFPNAISIKKYSIKNKSTAPVNSPRDWFIQGSNNGSSWENIDLKFNQTDDTPGALREYVMSSQSNKYLYYRIYVVASNGVGITAIDEIKYYTAKAENFPDGGPPYVIIF